MVTIGRMIKMAENHVTILDKLNLDRLAVNMFYGDEGTGKSTACYHAMKEIGGRILYIDTEGGFDRDRLKSICGDTVFPELIDIVTWTQLYEYVKQLKRSRASYDLVIIDSIGYLFRTEFLDDDSNTRLRTLKRLVNELAHIFINVRKMLETSNGVGIFTNWTKSNIQTDSTDRVIDEDRDFLGGKTAGFLSKNIYKFHLNHNTNDEGLIEVKKAKNIPKGTAWTFKFVDGGIEITK